MRRIAQRLWIVILCRVLMSAGYSVSFPYFAVYLHKVRGIGMGWIGTFLCASMLMTALLQAAGGSLADRWGRKPTMLLSLVARSLCVLGLAVAIGGGASFWALAALHLAGGLAGGLFDPAVRAWVADRFVEHDRARAYALTRMAGNFGWALGPAVGGVLAGTNYALLFYATAAAFVVSAALVFVLLEEHEGWRPAAPAVGQELAALRDPRLLRLCAGVALIGVVMSHLVAPLSLDATAFLRLSEAQVGILFSLNGALVVAFQIPVLHLFRASRLTVLLALGSLTYALGYGAVAFAGGFGALCLAMIAITMGENLVSPTMNAVAANLALPRERGRYLGALGAAQQLGYALGPLCGGWGLERWGASRPCPYWLAVAGAAALSAFVFAGLGARLSAREDGQSAGMMPVIASAEPA